MAVGQEVLVKPGADQFGQRDPVLQARRKRERIGGHQAGTGSPVLAPVDEHLAQAPVIVLASGEREPLRADGHGRGVPAATRWQLLPNTRHGTPF
jgi:hypothetical protein